MTDTVDAADAVTELWTADAERRARGKSAPESHPEFDGRSCVDCGDIIPTARLHLGRVRCVECQAALEWETKVGRR